ncbi:NADPH:quinone reductase [Tilletia horrida]|uniref:Probable quinone oxidoreductase n=1 Tax=Tilletia horrida TaxID=155126 RepID=A0AAN6JQV9_9BASI|nr:NADPH:quinone reductase [Tilletia horrida]
MAAELPTSMKAVQVTKTGDIDVIELQDIPVPQPGPSQVLFKAEYGGVNYIDTYHRSGLYKLALPFILGTEAAGTVVALGSEVQASGSLKVGDRVISIGPGAFAEYGVVERKFIAKIQDGVDSRTAAAAALQGLTALTLMREAYHIKKGDTVLIHAAAGGVGLLMVQLAVHFGATDIATTSTQAKADLVRAHGAQHTLLYGKDDYASIPSEVLKLTDGKGVQAIFDSIGKATFDGDFEAIAKRGTIVSFGNASGPVGEFSLLKLVAKNVKIVRPQLYNYLEDAEEHEAYSKELFDLIASGAVKINIHAGYPFTTDGVRQTQQDITSRGTSGKLVIKI